MAASHPKGVLTMRSKSIVLLLLALGCGLVASLGISQMMDRGNAPASNNGETEPIFVALSDLNGDGALDVLVGTDTFETGAPSDRVYMMLGNGDGSFRTPVTFAVGSRPDAVIAADMNGDAAPDIVTANQSDDSITVLAMGGCGGAPGEAWPTVCVQGASCSGQINWQCSAGASSPQCTLLCDCTASGVNCEEGCP